MRKILTAAALLACAAQLPALATSKIPEEAVSLQNVGFAQLENESPEKAEKSYRALIKALPEDPLGYANLAISLLRQQRSEEALEAIDQALEKGPGRGDLLAVRGDVLQWAGRAEEALTTYRQAAEAAPENPEILYALYRQAVTVETEAAKDSKAWALERLVRLRPENVVVLLASGQQAIAEGDRAAATGAFLRIRELLWQTPPIAETAMEKVMEALKGETVAAARVPALRLENVLKVSAMYRESLRELVTGIQGIPVTRFTGSTDRGDFGAPGKIRFSGEEWTDGAARAPVACDVDGDGTQDLAWILPGEEAAETAVELRRSGAEGAAPPPVRLPAPAGAETLLCTDLDNDGALDLLVFSATAGKVLRGDGQGGFTDGTEGTGLAQAGAGAAVALDFDIEGDLDLFLAGGSQIRGSKVPGELYFNDLQGPLQPVGTEALPKLDPARKIASALPTDLDQDGDLDLLLAHDRGVTWLDNLRQGTFADRTGEAALTAAAPSRQALSADLNNDGRLDVVSVGASLEVWDNLGGSFKLRRQTSLPGPFHAVEAFDADNDGRIDLALAGDDGVRVLQQDGQGGLVPVPLAGAPRQVSDLLAVDLDGDGDQDLLTAGPAGVHRLINQGGDQRNWIALRLRGLDKGSSKNNAFGRGALVEVRSGNAYQLREVHGDLVHLGLGDLRGGYLVRVVWTNGVPQNRLQLSRNQTMVEEQLLKGSCPFLYAWNGESMSFVSDLLWGAPIGMPLAPGVWAGADPQELVLVPEAAAEDGRYRMSITEELWEAAYFDYLRLWVVDHPTEVEVASSLRIQPGESVPDRVMASRHLRPLDGAWDGRGVEVGDQVARRDHVYADGYTPSRYQGVAAEPWSFTLDLGEAPAAPVRLHLDGWIFPADASLNLALAQRGGPAPVPPRLEVEVDGQWRTLMPSMGFPAGKTKTMIIDTPPLPPGAQRLRMVTGQWLHWDRIAWTTGAAATPDEKAVKVVAKLPAARADLHFRGFSRPFRRAPNAPHEFDYDAVTADSPWLPMSGGYTRYGDVRELLAEADDRSVILGAGDEVELLFDASELPPPPAGWSRTVFLESHGWDKDADRNTWAGDRVEPLPFRAMSGYPYGPGEAFPDTPEMQRYREEWLTRRVP
ncbi:MAG: FG-GAP-like repeat-containing protein [Acidobacteriota bacterium]|nr:FG-GAP-like repeat-containing protein [Acidobacteriota bacterium]